MNEVDLLLLPFSQSSYASYTIIREIDSIQQKKAKAKFNKKKFDIIVPVGHIIDIECH